MFIPTRLVMFTYQPLQRTVVDRFKLIPCGPQHTYLLYLPYSNQRFSRPWLMERRFVIQIADTESRFEIGLCCWRNAISKDMYTDVLWIIYSINPNISVLKSHSWTKFTIFIHVDSAEYFTCYSNTDQYSINQTKCWNHNSVSKISEDKFTIVLLQSGMVISWVLFM